MNKEKRIEKRERMKKTVHELNAKVAGLGQENRRVSSHLQATLRENNISSRSSNEFPIGSITKMARAAATIYESEAFQKPSGELGAVPAESCETSEGKAERESCNRTRPPSRKNVNPSDAPENLGC